MINQLYGPEANGQTSDSTKCMFVALSVKVELALEWNSEYSYPPQSITVELTYKDFAAYRAAIEFCEAFPDTTGITLSIQNVEVTDEDYEQVKNEKFVYELCCYPGNQSVYVTAYNYHDSDQRAGYRSVPKWEELEKELLK